MARWIFENPEKMTLAYQAALRILQEKGYQVIDLRNNPDKHIIVTKDHQEVTTITRNVDGIGEIIATGTHAKSTAVEGIIRNICRMEGYGGHEQGSRSP